MAQAKLQVNLLANPAGLTAGLNVASARLSAFGKKATMIGAKLGRSFSLPFALIAGGSMKMAGDFEKNMTKIKTLVGLSGDAVDGMADKVKALARETGVSATEASEALFFITSAGQSGDLALKTLRASLKASAVGLGDVSTVADSATSAMNAYGSEVLGASDATDVLMSTVRLGKIESEELAGSIGQVIPIASNLGVTFDEVGATLASMSRTGTNAATASMQLKNILMSINKPSSEAQKQLSAMGLSSEALKKKIKDDGLLSVLTLLKDKFGENEDAQAKVFGNARALMGVMDLLGAGFEDTTMIFNEMTKATGSTDKGFAELQKSSEFQLRKTMNGLKEDFRNMGGVMMQVLGPAVKNIMGGISALFKKFQGLDAGTQKLILGFGALVALAPVLISAVGLVAKAIAFLLSPVGLVVAGLAGIAYVVYTQWDGIKKIIVDVANYFIDLYNESNAFAILMHSIGAIFKSFYDIGVFFLEALVTSFQNGLKVIKDLFSGLGGIIKGVFTFDYDEIKAGVKKMGRAISDNFKNAIETGSEFVEKSAGAVADNFTEAFNNAKTRQKIEFITEDDIDNGVNNAVDYLKTKKDQIFEAFNFGSGGGTNMDVDTSNLDDPTSGGDDDTSKINKTTTALQEQSTVMEDLGLTSEFASEQMSNSFSKLSSGIVDNLGIANTALGDFMQNLINSVTEQIQANLMLGLSEEQKTQQKVANTATEVGANAMSVASNTATGGANIGINTGEAISGATVTATNTAKGMGPIGAFVLPALIAGAVGLVMSSMKKAKKFKTGGIVSGTTLGMVGEYPGAKSNPEVIAPLDRLKSMIGTPQATNVNVGGSFRVEGQDLVLALSRANNVSNRIN